MLEMSSVCKVCGVSVRAEGRCSNGVCLACHNDYCDMIEDHRIDLDLARRTHAERVRNHFQASAPHP